MLSGRLDRAAGQEELPVRRDRDDEFRAFVAARSGALLRTAYLLTGGDWGRAEDLLQTALTKTYLSWHRIRDLGALEGYVRATLATTAASERRRRWSGERALGVVPDVIGADPSHVVDESDALWRLVRRLPPRQRAVLVLRFYEDLSEAEVARLLGVSAGTVKSSSSRGLAALRARLAEEGQH